MSISTVNITKSFGTPPTNVLKGISLNIEDGEFVSLIGRSGSGKSTLLYILSSLDQPSSGQVTVDGHILNNMDEHSIHAFRNKTIGFVFQFHYLLPELTALENILMPAMKSGIHKEKEAYAMALLKEFGLADKYSRFPSQLSGGETQRISIARALVMEPKYIFADEPTGNLDTANGELVLNALERINKERQATIVMVTHDQGFAARAKRQIHLVDGKTT